EAVRLAGVDRGRRAKFEIAAEVTERLPVFVVKLMRPLDTDELQRNSVNVGPQFAGEDRGVDARELTVKGVELVSPEIRELDLVGKGRHVLVEDRPFIDIERVAHVHG